MMRTAYRMGAMALAISAVAACGNSDTDEPLVDPAEEVTTPAPAAVAEFDVEEVRLGRNLGPNGQVLEELGEFMPNDTIYVVVRTEGAGTSTLTARFLYEDGQLVDETTQTISPTGETLTEFHVSKPDGWPAGEYEVKILVNGEEEQSASFTVK